MTSPSPILLACFVHLMLHTSIFIQMDPDDFADTPILGSQIFYLSVMDLLCHCDVIPEHWKYVPPWGKFILETIVIFLVGEIFMVGVWLSMEALLVELIANVTNWTGLVSASSKRSKRFFLEISTLVLGIAFSVTVAAVTNRPAKIKKIGSKMLDTINQGRLSLFAGQE
ncbi:uncharacterized protein LOC108047273 [Drosophila rhopaloa]|uniref:Uncharacterized protein LOC108047273 n=1 Tax=Drosophila rhopaloa TaxID=1041015 RepID=A0A6P4EXJ2_DRORH|nr:uncharacterized protein LOC108047273 [Drosophila rhopaloa]